MSKPDPLADIKAARRKLWIEFVFNLIVLLAVIGLLLKLGVG